MKKIVRQALTPLVGLPLRKIDRSGSVLLAHFGDLREVPSRDGGSRTFYEWTIQIQCAWRISQGTRIVIAYRDFYYSDAPLKNLDVMNKSRFTTTLETLCAEFDANPPRVKSVESDDSGSFSVRLSPDYCFEVFPAENTESGKHWRIYEPGIQGRSFVFPPNET